MRNTRFPRANFAIVVLGGYERVNGGSRVSFAFPKICLMWPQGAMHPRV